jgi:phosphoribosylformylglycinamidine synthase I
MTRALVLRTAGTNCDRETVEALRRAGAGTELVHLRRLVAEPQRLEDAELVVFPGGFSYGDDIAAGRVFGYEVRTRLAPAFDTFVARGGYVLGVCNGFQILVDTGLLEPRARRGDGRRFALTTNASARFECRWVTLEVQPSACDWLPAGLRMEVPVAHAEGRYVPRDAAAHAELEAAGQIALRYVAAHGGPVGYPANPNGSHADVAGVCDVTGRVLGLMPHPERNIQAWHHPRWTRLPALERGAGQEFYDRLVGAAGGVAV